MVKINMREFSHNIARYIERACRGEKIVLVKRQKPVVDIMPHNESPQKPGWKRKIDKIPARGETFAQTVVKMRGAERA
ncbi:MAG TPA: hypothetical protein DE315_00745 [Candidatus Omnitrophica bacterium]|nr:MAG: hypothetical protein A2Y05_03375 [Omnitrophica WOR_2 bacterium GWA2_53_43]HBO97994.1 hypothetical protein [Candidatus Omnitrophota bacterium]HCI44051.1 hypothetical protein [Candidatus Omnitrophota bacterium]